MKWNQWKWRKQVVKRARGSDCRQNKSKWRAQAWGMHLTRKIHTSVLAESPGGWTILKRPMIATAVGIQGPGNRLPHWGSKKAEPCFPHKQRDTSEACLTVWRMAVSQWWLHRRKLWTFPERSLPAHWGWLEVPWAGVRVKSLISLGVVFLL